MGDGADGRDVEPHGEVDVASAGDLSWQAPRLAVPVGADQAPEHERLRVVVPAAARAELRRHAPRLQEPHPLVVRLLLLPRVVPVRVHEFEVGLRGQRQQGDLVQDGFDPLPADLDVDVADDVVVGVIVFGTVDGVEGWFQLLSG